MANFKAWKPVAKNTVAVANGPTKNPKKMTGTRLGKILGFDSWGTDFQAWCEIMRVAEPPFEGNKYTDAGNALEPKIVEWCKENVSPYVYTPEEFYGVKDAKPSTGYDFFPKQSILGGMWDAIILDGPLGKGKPLGYVEAKTSSRPQDWVDGPPLKYCIQGLLYGYLDGYERVYIPVRFMEPHEYDNPSTCVCDDTNTFLYELKVSETQINGKTIERLVDDALVWYKKHVTGNVSPKFDEKKDKDYLAIMRKSEVKSDDLETMAKEAADLEAKIAAIVTKNELAALEKRLKVLKDAIKPVMLGLFSDTDECVSAYGWRVKRTTTQALDKEAIIADGLFEKYSIEKATYTLSKEKANG